MKTLGALILLALVQCQMMHADECPSVVVQREQYLNPNFCWMEDDGMFRGFVITTPGNEGFIGRFVSKNCILSSDQKFQDPVPKELIILAMGDGLLEVEEFFVSQVNMKFIDNRRSHLPHLEIESDRVFYIEAKAAVVGEQRVREVEHIKIDAVLKFKDTGLSPLQFFKKREECISDQR